MPQAIANENVPLPRRQRREYMPVIPQWLSFNSNEKSRAILAREKLMNHDGLNKWHEAVETPPFPAMNSKSVGTFARPQGKDQHRDACPKQPDHAWFRNG